MEFGVSIFPTEYSLSVVDLGRELEERGFESLWLPEHTHIPVSRRSQLPGGAELPRKYRHTLDPFVALSAVAATTSKLRLATGICLIVQRDPITTAKEVASLDLLSGGRVLFGIGAGWNAEEMANHGTEYRTRFRLLRERALALKAIWTQEKAEYQGELVRFDPIWSYPKPAQKPHPPILLGGAGPRTLARVVEYADGWVPIVGDPRFRFEEQIAELQELTAAAGRGSIPVTAYQIGKPDPQRLAAYERAGVARYVFALPSEGADVVRPLLAEYAALARSFA